MLRVGVHLMFERVDGSQYVQLDAGLICTEDPLHHEFGLSEDLILETLVSDAECLAEDCWCGEIGQLLQTSDNDPYAEYVRLVCVFIAKLPDDLVLPTAEQYRNTETFDWSSLVLADTRNGEVNDC
jgi:hypothetical protein